METIHTTFGPDRNQVQRFLDALELNGKFTFQTIDDDADRHDSSLARMLHGTLDQHFDELVRLQQSGAGVFVTVNKTDGKGRKRENIRAVRALFIDLDGADLAPVRAWNEPDMICETSPGRWHCYWLMADAPLNEFKAAQSYLSKAFNADQSVKDLPRVMRVPGFFHQKKDRQKKLTGEPFMVSLEVTNSQAGDRKFGDFVEKLKADFPKQETSAAAGHIAAKVRTKSTATEAEVREALTYLDPDALHYDDWRNVLFAIHAHFGPDGNTIAEEWSSQGTKHREDDIPRRWDGFNQDGAITIKTLFALAKQHGCDLSALAAKHRQVRSLAELKSAAASLKPDNIEETEDILREASQLSLIEQEHVLAAINEATDMPLGALRKQMALNSESGGKPDDLALARTVLDAIGDDNILSTAKGVWIWNARGLWTNEEDRHLKKLVIDVLEDQNVSVSAARVASVTEVLRNNIYRSDHSFNVGDPEAVNCLNGTVKLQGADSFDPGVWVCETHDKSEYRTTQIPVEFDADAEAPRFKRFLEEVFEPDDDRPEKIDALLQLIGYTLMSHARHEKFVMLIGEGANGKSVLLDVIEQLCGNPNVSGVQPSNFDRTFQRAHLDMKLANIVTELRQGEIIADAELKAITSGEPSTVEHKHQKPFVMRPYCTCWFGTNHMPATRDFSAALFRRASVFQFNRVFAEDSQDKMLKYDLRKELPGILNLALKHYAEALVFGFSEPPSSLQAKAEWRLEADQVAQFLEDACERDPTRETKSSHLFHAYQCWANRQGIKRTVNQKTFSDRLIRLGVERDRKRDARYFQGIHVKEIPISDFDF